MDILPQIGLAQDSICVLGIVSFMGFICSVCLGVLIGNTKTYITRLGSVIFSVIISILIVSICFVFGLNKGYAHFLFSVYFINSGVCALGFSRDNSFKFYLSKIKNLKMNIPLIGGKM